MQSKQTNKWIEKYDIWHFWNTKHICKYSNNIFYINLKQENLDTEEHLMVNYQNKKYLFDNDTQLLSVD